MEKQIQRIKEKSASIKRYDEDLVVFGADTHAYQLDEPIKFEVVINFEQDYKINLPEAYVAFLTQVGNGNPLEDAYMGSAAGPYYGIYPFGEGLEDLNTNDVKKYISYPCLLQPDMTADQWSELTKESQDDTLSDEAYYASIGTLFGGLLPIGTQGCGITTCLIVNGEFEGKIVYLNEDYQPQFAHEPNFLAWYERWLDEIISGDLVSEDAGWFGYAIGGSSEFLWDAYKNSTNEKEQLIYLEGLLKKQKISATIIQEIVDSITHATEPVALSLLTLVAKIDFKQAIPFLEAQLEHNLLFVLQHIHWYGKKEAVGFLRFLEQYKDKIEEEETYRFYSYVITDIADDFAYLILPGLASTQASIRGQAIYTLGKIAHKQAYASYFIAALEDTDESVVLYALQALSNIEDAQLIQAYKKVYHKYKDSDEENYIGVNLNHRLKEIGLTIADLQE
ncbi:HEAT repeat domain-containing protein [Myroides odoratus]|uniref:HEAT repeat domain-containing protein n=1 Tax=Myroides odoratus TaxID=256 RepID=UPI0039B1150D